MLATLLTDQFSFSAFIMENLGKQVDQMIVKSKDLTDFCNIACSEEAKAIILKGADQVKDTADLLSKCKSAIQENPKLIRTMQAALHELQRQEIIMKCILEKSNSPVRQHQPQQNYLVSKCTTNPKFPLTQIFHFRPLRDPFRVVKHLRAQ